MAQRYIEMQRYLQKFTSLPPKTVVKQVKQGNDFATQAILMVNNTNYNSRLVKAGIIKVLLDHLQKPTEPFDESLDVAMPTVWINVLLNLTHPANLPPNQLERVRCQIAKNIDPLTNAMVDSKTRELFGSKDYYLSGLVFFIALLSNLVLSEQAMQILKDEPTLLPLLVQSLLVDLYGDGMQQEFVSAEARRMILPNGRGILKSSAARVLEEFVDVPTGSDGQVAEKDREYLSKLANMNASLDSNVLFPIGLMELIENVSDETMDRRGYESLARIQQTMQICLGPELFGTGATVKLVNILETYKMSCPEKAQMLFPSVYYSLLVRPNTSGGDKANPRVPSDNHIAAGVSSGLIELCLQYQPLDEGYEAAMNLMFQVIGETVPHRNTTKAIHARTLSIRREMSKSHVPSKYRNMVQAILDKVALTSADACSSMDMKMDVMCRWCKTTIPPEKMKRCGKCKRAIYCGRECQVNDWKHGTHKADCKQMRTRDIQDLEGGASKKDAKAARHSEKNLSMSGNVFFWESFEKIRGLASAKGVSITECVVLLDFRNTLPEIEILFPEEFLGGYNDDPEQKQYITRLLERNSTNGDVTVACTAISGEGIDTLLKTMPMGANLIG